MSSPARTPHGAADVEKWIVEARGGNAEALARLLQLCRPYLLGVANRELGTALQARVAPSDVVQDSLLEACRDFPRFAGSTEIDLLAWLRQILHHNLANERRWHVETAMRSVDREVPLAESPPIELRHHILDAAESPSAEAQARERDEALEQALQQLPEHYRQTLLLHTLEGLTFAQIGERFDCSAEAARKVWGRAAKELEQRLGDAS